MRILLAPGPFVGAAGAVEVTRAMRDGWLAGAPDDAVVSMPMGDGGPGLVATVHAVLGGDLVPVTVAGPLGDPTPCALLVLPGTDGPTVVVEAAQAAGRAVAPGADVRVAASVGVGELCSAALALEPRRVLVGLGGCVTHDAGAGMLAGLGVGTAVLRGGGGGLGALTVGDLAGLDGLRDRLAGVEVVVAADDDSPLLGLHGASAGLLVGPVAPVTSGSGVGTVSADVAQDMERVLGHVVHVVGSVVGPGTARAASLAPGSGAGGGMGFALALLGARLVGGADAVAQLLDLDRDVARADLVVTGERSLDPHSVRGGVLATLAACASRHGVPLVVVAGEVVVGRREQAAAGIAGAYALTEHTDELEVLAAAGEVAVAAALTARVRRVARTWSR